jgi:hypothetical protein
MDPVPEPLSDMLYTYCDANAPEMIETLRDRILRGEIPKERVNAIRSQLVNAIRSRSITPEQFRALTGEYLTAESVIERLREIFADLFQDEDTPS